jgi:hypothetical protein
MNATSNPPQDADGQDQLQAGQRLLGNKVRFHHWQPGTGILCTKVYTNGMVELHGMGGAFAPSLFEIDGETVAVPFEGKVD